MEKQEARERAKDCAARSRALSIGIYRPRAFARGYKHFAATAASDIISPLARLNIFPDFHKYFFRILITQQPSSLSIPFMLKADKMRVRTINRDLLTLF